MAILLRQLCLGGTATVAAMAAGALGCRGDGSTGTPVEQRHAAINNGTAVSAAQNPGTVAVYHQGPRPCSGTLLRPNWVVTARHCLTVDGTATGAFLNTNQVWIGPPNEVNPTSAINPGLYPPPTAIQALQFVEYQTNVDIALVELWSPIVPPREPSCTPGYDPYCLPALAAPRGLGLWDGDNQDLLGMTVRLMGYGRLNPFGDESDGSSGAGTLRMGDVTVSSLSGIFVESTGSPRTDHGDSGGSTYALTDRLGRSLYGLAAWHIFESNTDGSAAYFRPWLKRTTTFSGTVGGSSRTDIALVGGNGWTTFHWARSQGNGSFVRNTASGYVVCDGWGENCVSSDLSSFAWAAQNNKVVGGDFNGDNRLDIAVVGGPGTDLPFAYAMPDGTFLPAYVGAGSFATTAQYSGATPVSGDFNGDGRTDIALVHGSGLTSIPVAWSSEAGGLVPTDVPFADFPGWSMGSTVKPVTGDFDGDGRDDIALVGGSGWASIPIAHSNGDGSFTLSNQWVPDFPGWATGATAAVAGDFNGDGRDDIALVGGSGWGSIPVAFSSGGGNFVVTNVRVTDVPGWAQSTAKPVAGDFDGDGREDIALVAGSGTGWNTVPVAFSIGDGSFRVTNSGGGTFPSLAQTAGARPFAIHGGGPKRAAHTARDMVAGRHTDGRLEVFYVGTDDQMYRNQQLGPGSTVWSGEIPLGGTAKKIALAQHDNGRLELYFVGLNTLIYQLWEIMPWEFQPNGPAWSGGVSMGGAAKDLVVTMNADARLQMFYVGTDDNFWTKQQSSPSGSWNTDAWFGGSGKRIAVDHNLNGGVELFVIGTDDGVWRNSQSTPNGGFGGWDPLGGKARELVVGHHQDGRFQYFYIATDGADSPATTVRTNYQVLGGGGAWNGDILYPLSGAGGYRALDLDMERTSDDRLALITTQADGTLYEHVQATQNGNFPVVPNYTTGVPRPRSVFVVPASAYGPSEVLYISWDGVLHAETPGSTPGHHTGDRIVGDVFGDQNTIVCGMAEEWGPPLTMTCPAGKKFVGSRSVLYGLPTGSCADGFHAAPSCDVPNTPGLAVYSACLGKESCSITVSNDVLAPGTNPCVGIVKHLYAQMYCL